MTTTEFLTFLLKEIVDTPEAVLVDEERLSDGSLVLHVRVKPEDMGKVIGKEGRIIKSIRDLTRLLAMRQNERVNVVLEDQNQPS